MRALRVCLPAALAALLPAQTLDVQTATLSNGLKILVHEDHDIPNVALYLFYRIGSRNERPGATGVSHFFEHMMFNGAKKYGPKQFDIVMEKNGGRNNAYTTRDTTVYTDWFPRTMLELMFDLEADRLRDLGFDPQIIESERGVVYSERRSSVDNSNFGVLYEQLNAAAYTAHPYGWPVVGWASDIEAWTLDDLKSHFRMGYAPNNCVLVVAGDITAPEVIALAKKYLEPLPAQPPPPPIRTREPEQRGERRVVVRKPAQLPILMVSFHVPQSNHPDHETLRVLGNLLTEGRSSRLYRRLVDTDQLAIQVSSFQQHSLDPGQLIINVQPRSGVELARLEKALFEELDRLAAAPVSAEELQKAKNQLLTSLYRQWKTISGKADLLGRYEVFFGDHRKLFAAEKDLEKATAAEVQRAAKQYLRADNRTIATLIPEKQEAAR